MKKYVGTKMIEATPMNRGDYNKYKGWTIPEDENPEDEGYLVKYKDDYESWSPKDVFEESYKDCMGMTFGIALELCKNGVKIAREGWNADGMFIVYHKGYSQGISCNKQTAEAWSMNEGDSFVCNPYLQIKCANGSHSMWTPSVDDCLAEDWVIVE